MKNFLKLFSKKVQNIEPSEEIKQARELTNISVQETTMLIEASERNNRKLSLHLQENHFSERLELAMKGNTH